MLLIDEEMERIGFSDVEDGWKEWKLRALCRAEKEDSRCVLRIGFSDAEDGWKEI